MEENIKISIFDMVTTLSTGIDLVSKSVNRHHEVVSYISYQIAQEINLPIEDRLDLVIAAALHDIGAISLQDRLKTLDFELEDCGKHAEVGYQLLKDFTPLADLALVVRYHHLEWNHGEGLENKGITVPLASHILHLADRVAVAIDPDREILGQKNSVCNLIKDYSGEKFNPKLVTAFLNLVKKEAFWLSISTPDLIKRSLSRKFKEETIRLDLDSLLELSDFFSKVIDFRSSFTATHSRGVAVVAEKIAKLVGWSRSKALKMRIAGYLHDLGKLAIPAEILNKQGKLNAYEINIIKSHVFYTYYVLDLLEGLEDIKQWAGLHHERLDGKGYPFNYTERELPTGAKIMAVADVFTAITEDRPYRLGMEKDKAVDVLKSMVNNKTLDSEIVEVLVNNYDDLNELRKSVQKEVSQTYIYN